jgi:hypothetical protein
MLTSRRVAVLADWIIVIGKGKKAETGESTTKGKTETPSPAWLSALVDSRAIYGP